MTIKTAIIRWWWCASAHAFLVTLTTTWFHTSRPLRPKRKTSIHRWKCNKTISCICHLKCMKWSRFKYWSNKFQILSYTYDNEDCYTNAAPLRLRGSYDLHVLALGSHMPASVPVDHLYKYNWYKHFSTVSIKESITYRFWSIYFKLIETRNVIKIYFCYFHSFCCCVIFVLCSEYFLVDGNVLFQLSNWTMPKKHVKKHELFLWLNLLEVKRTRRCHTATCFWARAPLCP
jgi:hypothetical protein